MVLRKITIDNSVRYIPKTEKTKEKENKQNKNISQNSKKFPKNVAASGFGYITKYYLCKHKNNNFAICIRIIIFILKFIFE